MTALNSRVHFAQARSLRFRQNRALDWLWRQKLASNTFGKGTSLAANRTRRAAAASPSVGVLHHSVTFLFALLGVTSVAAIWSILSLISGGFGGFFALLVALVIVLLLHAFGYRAGFKRGCLALALMAASTVYQAYIFASGTIAGEMGFSLRESALLIGPKLAFALVRAHTVSAELWCYGLALVLAFGLGVYVGRERR